MTAVATQTTAVVGPTPGGLLIVAPPVTGAAFGVRASTRGPHELALVDRSLAAGGSP